MSKYRKRLPQLGDRLFMTDGGLETWLVFHEGIDLPAFAAFDVLKDQAGVEIMRRYFERYTSLAQAHGLGLLLDAPTWRANADWGAGIGYDEAALADANRKSVGLMLELRAAHETPGTPIVVSGVIGPRGDGYVVDRRMTREEATAYHDSQIGILADTDADMVTAYTLNYVDEAIGVAAAAQHHAIPVAISFTVETDGRLPSGELLAEAIHATDEATGCYPAYYMINCAHPEHFAPMLEAGGDWIGRIRGLRANASRLSHAELEQCTTLDEGDPVDFGAQFSDLRRLLPGLTVLGGCCGTDHRHLGAVCSVVAPIAVPGSGVAA